MLALVEHWIGTDLLLCTHKVTLISLRGLKGCRDLEVHLFEILKEFFGTEVLCNLDDLIVVLQVANTTQQHKDDA